MIKPAIILLYLTKKAFDAIIDFLDSQHIKKALPENVRDVYNEVEYQNWLIILIGVAMPFLLLRGRMGLVERRM